MKIHSLFAEILIFLVVSLFFVFPPAFNGFGIAEETIVVQWVFPFHQLILAIFSLIIFLLYHNYEKSKINILGIRIFQTVCLLFTTSFFLNFLAHVYPNLANDVMKFSLPDSFVKWIFCILNFLAAAFYEEVIYRFYFTDKLYNILKQLNHFFEKKLFVILCEIFGCAVFAFAHGYLGVLAIVNAAIAHFILRYAYKKSNSIIPGFIAHFFYNVISLILL